MTATEELRHEHEMALLVLQGAQETAAQIDENGLLPATRIDEMLDFFRNFLDRCHHAKEERHLFPKILKKGSEADRQLVAELLAEHERGRKLVPEIAAGLAAPPEEARVASALRAYAALLRQHIGKENDRLFPAADKLLSDREQKEMEGAFARIEAEEMGEGVHEKYHRLAHELAEPGG